MPEEFMWKILFFLIFISFSLIRLPYAIKNKKNRDLKIQSPKTEKLKVFIAAVGMMILPLIYMFTPFLDFLGMNFPIWIRIIGCIGLILSAVFFFYIHRELDKNWSPVLEIKKDHKLIITGPYKYVRHPMYTQCWAWVLFQFLLVSNWIVGVTGLVTWSILYFTRIDKEEEMMIEAFGTEYEEYMEITGRLLPRLV